MGRVSRLAFLPGAGGVIASSQSDVGRFDPVDLTRLVLRKALGIPDGIHIQGLAARPDGGEVLVAFGSRVVFLDPDELRPIPVRRGWLPRPKGWSAGNDVLDAKYTPDGRKVLIARRDNMAELLDAATGERVAEAMPHRAAVVSVAVSPDGKVLLTGSRDMTARFWDAATGLPLGGPLRHLGPVTHVAYAPDGKHVATGTGTGHVLVWDVPPPPAAGSLEDLRTAIKNPKE